MLRRTAVRPRVFNSWNAARREWVHGRESDAMKVMVIVKASKASEAGEMPSRWLLADMDSFNAQLVKAGLLLAGDGLHHHHRGS